ncbi:MAG: hypothetical protein AAFY38_02315 [Pseudomonadota bacterium]
MRLLTLLALFGVLATQAAAQTDLARCEQTTVQFPQACPCIIERSEAAGITGQTLSQLLVNNTDGVPIDTFQAYGAVFVQCIQSAVLAGVPAAPVPPAAPAAPSPAAPSPIVPAQTPAPAGADIPGPPVQGPLVRGTIPAGFDNETLSLFIREDRPAGTWGRVSLARGPGFQGSAVGTHDGQGHLLLLNCQSTFTAEAPYIALAGLAPKLTQPMQITVLRGNGQELLSTYARGQAADGAVLLMPLYRVLVDALRAGSRVRFALNDGPTLEFGLRGSSAALGDFCARQPPQRFQYLAGELFAPDGGWRSAQVQVVSRQSLADDVLLHVSEAPLTPGLMLTCDRRIAARGTVFGYGAENRRGVIGTPNGQIVLQFSPSGALQMASQPLTEGEIATLSAADAIRVTFDTDMEPGDFTGATYQMDGFADALASLTCPPPPGPIGPTARIDASGLKNAWTAADIGWVFDGMSGNPAYTPGAFFTTDIADVPTLGMQCNGEPFVVDPWPGPRFTVRMEVDGTAQEIEWFSSRAHYFPEYLGNEAFFNGILDGAVLRMTLTTDTRLDVAYSLDGLRQALSAAGCP